MKISVVSDTHGLLRPSVLRRIEKSELILHAGDVGAPEILETLESLAPTHAIRGNVDREEPLSRLPATETIRLGNGSIHIVHDIADLDLSVAPKDLSLVVFGHSHSPVYYEKSGIGYLNPGSIGPRRFKLPISYAVVDCNEGRFTHEFHTLKE